MSPARASLLVALATTGSRLLGFARDVMIAGLLGAGPVADAFLVAFRIPNLVRRVLSEGGLNAGFVPIYLAARRSGGEAAARLFASKALTGFAALVLGLVALVEIGAGFLVLATAAGFADDPATLDLATLYTRLGFPFVAGAAIAALISAQLNAERRFLAASLAPLVVNALLVAMLAWLSTRPDLAPEMKAAWLAGAVSLSGLLHLAIVALAARDLGLAPRLSGLATSPDLKRWLRLGLPALGASASAQLMILAAAAIASFEPGSVAWFYYAERVFQLPLGFVAAGAGLVLLPELAGQGDGEGSDPQRIAAAQNRALETALLVAAPAAIALVVLAPPIASVLFQRGAFGNLDAAGTAAALAGLGLGLPFGAAVKVLSQTLFARHATGAVALTGLVAIAVTGLAAAVLAPSVGVFGIGLGVSLGFLAHAILIVAALARRGLWQPDRRLVSRTGRILAASLAMALGLMLARSGVEANGRTIGAGWLAAFCCGGVILYAAAALGLGAVQRRDLATWLRS